MVKKTFLYIFIYTLLVGCGTDYMMGWNDDLIYSCDDKSGGMNDNIIYSNDFLNRSKAMFFLTHEWLILSYDCFL